MNAQQNMDTPTDYDVVIVGAGMAGLAAALALASTPLSICLIDNNKLTPPKLCPTNYDLKVSALTEASYHFLHRLGIWSEAAYSRMCTYERMEVWDAEGTGRIRFHAREVGYPHLGRIVENKVIISGLLSKLKATPVALMEGIEVNSINNYNAHVAITYANEKQVTARLLIAADGANSLIRRWAQIPTNEKD